MDGGTVLWWRWLVATAAVVLVFGSAFVLYGPFRRMETSAWDMIAASLAATYERFHGRRSEASETR